jgi:hypothetical protein
LQFKARCTLRPGGYQKSLQEFATEEDLAALKEESATKDKHAALKEEHAALEERLERITDAFEPATQHALFETAIYEFVDKRIPSAWIDQGDKIKHGIVALCLDAIEILLSDGTKKLRWHGPSTRKASKNIFPKDILPLVLGGLAGLAVYINFEQGTTLRAWDLRSKTILPTTDLF